MEKLYEQNPYQTYFTACVQSCVQGKKGFDVILSQTAFYPEGGGQPYDTGTLGNAQVLEVHEREGRVIHTCDQELPVGAVVEGAIDWERRFDLMQNHSGEHIVSGIAHQKWGCDNVGFHMGAELITIDLSLVITEAQLRELEADVNRYLLEDHPVVITYPSAEELEQLTYRSKKALSGQVRIVSFPGADTCACCGTHVASTGQIGLIKLLSVQKFREGVRIELVCGNRAFSYLSRILEQNQQISNLLSAKRLETASAVQRLLSENEELKSHIYAMEEQRFTLLQKEYANSGDVFLFDSGLSADCLRRMCSAILETCGGQCACFSANEESGYKYAIGKRGGDLRPLAKQLNQQCSGRGGGKPDFVQGNLSCTQADIEAFFSTQIQ